MRSAKLLINPLTFKELLPVADHDKKNSAAGVDETRMIVEESDYEIFINGQRKNPSELLQADRINVCNQFTIL